MKKRIFGILLMGAMVVASMSMFTSCKDYDDDINNLQKQIDGITAQNLQSQLTTLQSALTTAQSAAAAAQSAADAAATAAKNAQGTADQAVKDAAAADAIAKAAATAQDVKDLKEAIEKLEGIINGKVSSEDLQKAIKDLEGKIAAVDEKLLTLDEVKKLLADQGFASDAVVKDLTSQIKTLNAYKAALEKAGLSEATVADQVAKINAAITTLNALTAEGGDIAAIKELAKKASDAVNGITGKVNNLNVLLEKRLTSIVNNPKGNYLETFNAIPVYSFPNKFKTITFTAVANKNTPEKQNYSSKANYSIPSLGVGFYWLNPSTADIDKYDFSFIGEGFRNKTRAAGITSAPRTSIKSYSAENGLLTVVFSATNINDGKAGGNYTAAEAKNWFSSIALKAVEKAQEGDEADKDYQGIVSDYAVLDAIIISDLEFANTQYDGNVAHAFNTATKNGVHKNHLAQNVVDVVADATPTQGGNNNVANAGIFTASVAINNANGINLRDYVNIHYYEANNTEDCINDKHTLTLNQIEAAGMNVKFTPIDFYYGNDKIETSSILTVSEAGNVKAAGAVGDFGIIRVELIYDNKTIKYGYVSVRISAADVAAIEPTNKHTGSNIACGEVLLGRYPLYDEIFDPAKTALGINTENFEKYYTIGTKTPAAATGGNDYRYVTDNIDYSGTPVSPDNAQRILLYNIPQFYNNGSAYIACDNFASATTFANGHNTANNKHYAIGKFRVARISNVNYLEWYVDANEAKSLFYDKNKVRKDMNFSTVIALTAPLDNTKYPNVYIKLSADESLFNYLTASLKKKDSRILSFWYKSGTGTVDTDNRDELHMHTNPYVNPIGNQTAVFDGMNMLERFVNYNGAPNTINFTFTDSKGNARPSSNTDNTFANLINDVNNNFTFGFDTDIYDVADANWTGTTELNLNAANEFTGASGAKYRFVVNGNGLYAVKANAQGKFLWGNSSWISWLYGPHNATIEYAANDYSNDILNAVVSTDYANAFAAHLKINPVANTCMPVEITESDLTFDVRFIRPLNVVTNASPFTLQDAATPGAPTDISQATFQNLIAGLTDWNGVAITNAAIKQSEFLTFYGVQNLTVDLSNATTDLNGNTSDKLSAFPGVYNRFKLQQINTTYKYTAPSGTATTGTYAVEGTTYTVKNSPVTIALTASQLNGNGKYQQGGADHDNTSTTAATGLTKKPNTLAEYLGQYAITYSNTTNNTAGTSVGTFHVYLPVALSYTYGTQYGVVTVTVNSTHVE